MTIGSLGCVSAVKICKYRPRTAEFRVRMEEQRKAIMGAERAYTSVGHQVSREGLVRRSQEAEVRKSWRSEEQRQQLEGAHTREKE